MEPKVISLFATSIEPDQPANPRTLTVLYTVDWPPSRIHLDISKTDNGQFQKWKMDKSISGIQQDKG